MQSVVGHHGVGIIPALAGNTCFGGGHCPESSDHPRSRGEYTSGSQMSEIESGSSPLSRGIPICSPHSLSFSWIIPALAGNTSPRMN